MKRVLLVTYYFPPLGGGGIPRALKLAKYLPAFGWEPHVLTVRNGVWSAADASPLAELPPQVTIHRAPMLMPGRLLGRAIRGSSGAQAVTEDRLGSEHPSFLETAKQVFRKVAYVPDEFVGWLPFALRLAKRIVREKKIDALISTSPPHTAHLIGGAIRKATGLPWIADFRDPWTRNPSFQHGGGLRGRLEERLERGVLRRATRIVTVTEPHREEIITDHRDSVDPRSVLLIPNGFDPEDFEGGTLPAALAPDPGVFRVVYTGGWFDHRSPRTFFEALTLYRATPGLPPIEAIFAGTAQAELTAGAERLGVSALVRCVGYLPARACCALQRSADALLLIVNARGRGVTQIPGKTFQYLGAGRPVLALSPPGIVADLVRKTGAGLVVDPDDARGVARSLVAMAKAKSAGMPSGGADPRTLVPYTRRAIAERYAAVLDTVSHPRASGG